MKPSTETEIVGSLTGILKKSPPGPSTIIPPSTLLVISNLVFSPPFSTDKLDESTTINGTSPPRDVSKSILMIVL